MELKIWRLGRLRGFVLVAGLSLQTLAVPDILAMLIFIDGAPTQ
jgi:hypothetical protein